MSVFKEYAKLYDALNCNKDYEKESYEIEELIKHYNSKKEILMLGCGTGKHDRVFAKKGFIVHGIDMSPEMVEIANDAKGDFPLSYEVGDIKTYKNSKKYPIILALFHVMSYQNENEDIVNTFMTVAENLEDDGVFIFDAWFGVGVLRELPETRIKRVALDEVDVLRIAEPKLYLQKNVVDVNYTILITDKDHKEIKQKIEEKHSMRYLFVPEIVEYLKKCGLELIKCIDCKTLREVDLESWTAYFIVKKRK